MERLYCQGVVANVYGRKVKGTWMVDKIENRGLRPKVRIPTMGHPIKGFNARGVSIALAIEPSEVEALLHASAAEMLSKGGGVARRQQILDDWVKEQNDVNGN